MSTLQSLNTWLTFNKIYTHREASIGFLKNTLVPVKHYNILQKKRVTIALMKVDLSEEEIIALQQTTENDVNNTQTN